MMCRLQNGNISDRIQFIEQNGKDILFISIDSLRRLLQFWVDISKKLIYWNCRYIDPSLFCCWLWKKDLHKNRNINIVDVY